jgi:CHASE3 domain sensor protein
MTIRLRLLTGFLILIIIFLISFFVNQRLSTEVIRNGEYINRSEAVIRNSNLIHKYMIDMQSGYRGYLLTSQVDFLEPFHEGLASIPPLIKEQHNLTSSPEQNLRLDSIMEIHSKWVAYANSLIDTKQDTLPESSARYRQLFEQKVKTGTGKKMNDDIRKMFNHFDSYEYRVRYERRKKLEESIESTRRINLSLTISSIALALVSSFVIIRFITRRISQMATLAGEISKGNFKTINDDKQDELTKLSESLNTMSAILDKNFQDLTQKNKELDRGVA